MSCKYPKFRESAGCVVACGQCTPCLLKKQRERASRVLLEDRAGLGDPLFVTLTYDEKHLPLQYSCKIPAIKFIKCPRERKARRPELRGVKRWAHFSCDTGTLRPDHVRDFMKRLRYYAVEEDIPKLRAVYAGEYGDDNARPHYHLITWGIPYKKRNVFFQAWTDDDGELMCAHERLEVEVPKNERHVSNYLAKYLLTSKRFMFDKSLNGAYPEFYRTSKGLGLQYAQGIANALMKESGLANLWLEGKIPSNFFFDGKNFPLDRYMKGKVYELLPPVFKEELPKAALAAYKEELHSLYEAALQDADIAPRLAHLTYDEGLEYIVSVKNARKAMDIELKHSFFTTKRKPKDV